MKDEKIIQGIKNESIRVLTYLWENHFDLLGDNLMSQAEKGELGVTAFYFIHKKLNESLASEKALKKECLELGFKTFFFKTAYLAKNREIRYAKDWEAEFLLERESSTSPNEGQKNISEKTILHLMVLRAKKHHKKAYGLLYQRDALEKPIKYMADKLSKTGGATRKSLALDRKKLRLFMKKMFSEALQTINASEACSKILLEKIFTKTDRIRKDSAASTKNIKIKQQETKVLKSIANSLNKEFNTTEWNRQNIETKYRQCWDKHKYEIHKILSQ